MSYTAARHVDGLTGIDVRGGLSRRDDDDGCSRFDEGIGANWQCTRISITSSRNYNHPANLDVLEGWRMSSTQCDLRKSYGMRYFKNLNWIVDMDSMIPFTGDALDLYSTWRILFVENFSPNFPHFVYSSSLPRPFPTCQNQTRDGFLEYVASGYYTHQMPLHSQAQDSHGAFPVCAPPYAVPMHSVVEMQ